MTAFLKILIVACTVIRNLRLPWNHNDDGAGRRGPSIQWLLSDKRSLPAHPAIAIARERWRMVSFLRVDADERCVEVAEDGTWVRGWLKVTPFDADRFLRYENALAALPFFTREVYLTHRNEQLDYSTVARQYGISPAEAERFIADALLAISNAMRDPA
ncbi:MULTISPECIES: hypothetical protein [unclassified Sphingomonas]|uniref:hypothetical protein n=1 Tax=unclassified Sphingomonas TaxID=196159 RepID=UPI0028621224|nr:MULTISPECIES: hypothetical protein [unclassified Sphingomonas]MDR6116596.1 hypothetical protein [Sphingomonas sp. SORGH_AS_0789]MDR6149727.1 hypothetical protein [Sphingomonas sp. SORGH_AS_0742]